MTAVNAGIIYQLRLGLPSLMADIRASESAIQSHVARMSQLKIVIPVTFAMPAGMPGMPGGGASSIVNNVLNSSTFNTSNNTNNAVTNYFNQVTNTINNINNAANAAANAAKKHGGSHGGMAGLSRHLGVFAILRTAEQVIRNEAEWTKELDKASSGTQIAQADVKHRESYRNVFFGLGNYGVALRNTFEEATGGASTESVEKQIEENERSAKWTEYQEKVVGQEMQMRDQATIAQTPSGNSRRLKQMDVEREAKRRELDKMSPEEQARLDEIAAKRAGIDESEKSRYIDPAEKMAAEQQQLDQMNAEIASALPGDKQRLISGRDTWQSQLHHTSERAELDQQQKVVTGGHDKRVSNEMQSLDDKQAAERADLVRESAERRDSSDIRATRDAAILMGGNSQRAIIASRRAEDALQDKKELAEKPKDEAASAANARKQATDLAEKQGKLAESAESAHLAIRAATARRELGGDVHGAKLDELAAGHRIEEGKILDPAKRKEAEDANRAEEAVAKDKADKDEQKKEADSQDKIGEIRSKGHQAQLREAGETQQAELEGFDQAQTQRIAALDNAIAHEEDADQKRRLIDQREAERAAQKLQRIAFVAEQARKFAAEEEEAANKLARTRAEAAEYALHAEGKSYQEGEARFKESWDARIRDEQAAVDKTIAGSPERRRAEAQLAATQAARGQDERARTTDEATDLRQRQSQIGQTELRARGQDYTARLKGITDKAQKEYDDAHGDPGKQALIRQQETADLQEEQHEIRQKHAKGEAVVGSRTDLTGKYSGADKMENLLKVNQNIEIILKSIRDQLVPRAT